MKDQSKDVWVAIVSEKLPEPCFKAIAEKLRWVKFSGDGQPVHTKGCKNHRHDVRCVACYAEKHFPRLIGLHRIRLQADAIPARSRRTREEMYTPEARQSKLWHNQLLLFGGEV